MPNIILENGSRRREINCASGANFFEALAETDWLPRADCGGRGACGRCRVRVSPPEALPPTALERVRLPAAALAEGVRLACLARPQSDLRMVIEPPEAGAAPWPEIADLPPVPWPEAASGQGLGVAIDLGSTNIRVSLLDLGSGRRLAARRGHNPQLRYGADVLTRLVRAAVAQTGAAIARDSRVAIAEGLVALFGQDFGGRRGDEAVTRVGIVGNTAVLALLTGQGGAELLEPDTWGRQIVCADGDFGRWRRGWGLGGAAEIRVWESLSGFVGSDLLAGVAGCGLLAGPAPALLVDFGTNTEIALWDGAALWVTAAAGGPAFEGSGISCGLPAEAGAVHRVAWAEGAEAPELSVLGGGPALGLCGSGLVDAVAALRRRGLLAPSGRMAAAVPRRGCALGPEGPWLSRGDIDVFQRAKAAVAAGIRHLLRRAGVAPAALARIAVGGIFGRHLDLANAQAVGLLPPGPAGRLLQVQDAALCGCERLLAGDGAAVLDEMRRLARPLNLAAAADYEELFIDSLRLVPLAP